MKRLLAVLALLSVCALGQGRPRYTYAHLTQATANNLLSSTGPAEIHTIVVNSSTSGTIQIQDTTASNCSGGSAVSATQTVSAGAVLTYDVTTTNGLCIVTGGTVDVTVSYRINR